MGSKLKPSLKLHPLLALLHAPSLGAAKQGGSGFQCWQGSCKGQAFPQPCSSWFNASGPTDSRGRFFSAAEATSTFSSGRKEEKRAGLSEMEQKASL